MPEQLGPDQLTVINTAEANLRPARQMNPLANPDNWELVYVASRKAWIWAYIGPHTHPWNLL